MQWQTVEEAKAKVRVEHDGTPSTVCGLMV
jgi:hypothetical protein